MSETDIFMHEVKNALSNIYLLIELIESDKSECDECLPLIKESIEQIKNIEHDYDLYRRLGKIQISCDSINLASMLNIVVREHQAMADDRNIKVEVMCGILKLKTDYTKLKQVLSNLLSNAIKYTLPGGRVLIEVKILNGKIHIYVKDTGIGMTTAEIAKLGTAFYRCKKIEVNGTGLGWTLIKSIVVLMNWDVAVYSGAASRFEYTTTVVLIL